MGLNRVRAGIVNEPIRGPFSQITPVSGAKREMQEDRGRVGERMTISLIPSQEKKGERKKNEPKAYEKIHWTSKSSVLECKRRNIKTQRVHLLRQSYDRLRCFTSGTRSG